MASCGTRYNKSYQNAIVYGPDNRLLPQIDLTKNYDNPEMKIGFTSHDIVLECKGAEVVIKKQYKDPQHLDFGDWRNFSPVDQKKVKE